MPTFTGIMSVKKNIVNMKRQQIQSGHRWFALPVLCLSALIMASACGCVKSNCQSKQITQKGVSLITMDSIARTALSDTVLSIMMHPQQVSLYTLSPLTRPGDNDFTIGNYKVVKKEGEISLDYYTVLIFLLADSCIYDRGENVQAIKFMPSHAITVISETDSVSLLYSHVSMEIGVVHEGYITNIFRYNNQRQFLLFFNNILENDMYNEMLNTLQQ